VSAGGSSDRGLVPAAAVFAGALAIRCVYLWSVWDSPSVRYPMGDALAYHEKALAIVAGDWLGDRAFYQDPLYPYFLALLYALFGEGSVLVRTRILMEEPELAGKAKAAGVSYTNMCAVVYSGMKGFSERVRGVTNSAKNRAYSSIRYFPDQKLIDIMLSGKV